MTKKDFKSSVMNFISEDSIEKAEGNSEANSGMKIPEGYKLVPDETKSRRLQLLIQPSLYNKIKAKAEAEGKSVNEKINEILRESIN